MPILGPVSFSSILNADSLLAKLIGFNEKQLNGEFHLTAEQLGYLEEFSRGELTFDVTDGHLEAIERFLLWPKGYLLPVLDIFRIALLHRSVNAHIFCKSNRGLKLLDRLCGLIASIDLEPSIQVMVCRIFSNAIAGGQHGQQLLIESDWSAKVIPLMCQLLHSQNTGVQLSAAITLSNISWAYFKAGLDGVESPSKLNSVQLIVDSLNSGSAFIENGSLDQGAIFRLLQSIETIIWDDTESLNLAMGLNLIDTVRKLKEASYDERGKAIAHSIESLLNDEDEINGEDGECTYDVFVSYRRDTGSVLARLVKTELQKYGWKIFLDVDNLLDLGDFEQALKEKIKSSKVLVLVLSKNSLDNCVKNRDMLRTEIELAVDLGLKIVPLYVSGFDWSVRSSLPPKVQTAILENGLEYSHVYASACFKRLYRMISGHFSENEPVQAGDESNTNLQDRLENDQTDVQENVEHDPPEADQADVQDYVEQNEEVEENVEQDPDENGDGI